MTCFLASVTSVAEARIAINAGADIIDLKDPSQGALGALPMAVIEDIVRFVDGRRPVSSTVGDLPMLPDGLLDAVEIVADSGVDIIKVGFFGSVGHVECVRALATQASNKRIVAVMFADQRPDFSLITLLAEANFYGAMLDTADKAAGGLCDWLEQAVLQSFVDTARKHGLLVGLAGSLRLADIGELSALDADYLGFRRALCSGNVRESTLDSGRINEAFELLRGCNNSRALASV
jgi:uncharacterized protein (UPF0264 family)